MDMHASRTRQWAVVAAVLAALLTGCASRPQRPPVTVDEVVRMSAEGVPPADIVARLEESDTVYRLSGSELARLKERGVPDEVLDHIQDTYLDYERGRAYRSYPYPYPWWGPSYAYAYPYPYWGYYGSWYRPYPYHRHRPHARPPKSSSGSGASKAWSGTSPRPNRPGPNKEVR